MYYFFTLNRGLFLPRYYTYRSLRGNLSFQGRFNKINGTHFFTTFISGASIVAGSKLIYVVINGMYLNYLAGQYSLESDKIYTIAGGGLVVWNSILSLHSKVKREKTNHYRLKPL